MDLHVLPCAGSFVGQVDELTLCFKNNLHQSWRKSSISSLINAPCSEGAALLPVLKLLLKC